MKKLSYITIFVAALGLIVFAQPEWTEYSGNPVFGEWIGGPKAYYPCVHYNQNGFQGQDPSIKYMMWYGTSNSDTGLAISEDGIFWINQGVVIATGYHAWVVYDANGFGGSGYYYKIWYWIGGSPYNSANIRYAESTDGVNWVNDQAVFGGTSTGGDWDRGCYGPGQVL